MFDFLKKKQLQSAAATSITPNANQQHSDIRRELIRVVLKDTLRLHGIPLHWLACEVIIIARAPGDEELHIQLVLMKWHAQLLLHALALQQQLLLGLDRFDPSVDHSSYIVSWRLSPDCGCPVTGMPAPGFWLEHATPQVQEETPLSLLDRRHTPRAPNTSPLEEVAAPAQAPGPEMFSPTQMTPLR